VYVAAWMDVEPDVLSLTDEGAPVLELEVQLVEALITQNDTPSKLAATPSKLEPDSREGPMDEDRTGGEGGSASDAQSDAQSLLGYQARSASVEGGRKPPELILPGEHRFSRWVRPLAPRPSVAL
jgi:hypothetical protein